MISFVICSINPDKFRNLEANLSTVMGDVAYELIHVTDAKSLCEGYNRAIKRSIGSVVIFCHDDIEILLPNFGNKILQHLRSVDLIGVAGTSKVVDGLWRRAGWPYIHGQVGHYQIYDAMPYVASIYDFAVPATEGRTLSTGMQALDGVFVALHRRVLDNIRYDEITFDGFHGYDIDFTYRAYLKGYSLGVFSDSGLIHYSKGKYDENWEKFNLRFKQKHAGNLPIYLEGPADSANVLYPTKEKLATSFTLPVQRELAKKLSSLRLASTGGTVAQDHNVGL